MDVRVCLFDFTLPLKDTHDRALKNLGPGGEKLIRALAKIKGVSEIKSRKNKVTIQLDPREDGDDTDKTPEIQVRECMSYAYPELTEELSAVAQAQLAKT